MADILRALYRGLSHADHFTSARIPILLAKPMELSPKSSPFRLLVILTHIFCCSVKQRWHFSTLSCSPFSLSFLFSFAITGHVSRSSGLAKIILQGTVKRGRRQGRQKKRLENNIREWTGLEFAKSQRAVENREKWRKRCEVICGAPSTPAVKE